MLIVLLRRVLIGTLVYHGLWLRGVLIFHVPSGCPWDIIFECVSATMYHHDDCFIVTIHPPE